MKLKRILAIALILALMAMYMPAMAEDPGEWDGNFTSIQTYRFSSIAFGEDPVWSREGIGTDGSYHSAPVESGFLPDFSTFIGTIMIEASIELTGNIGGNLVVNNDAVVTVDGNVSGNVEAGKAADITISGSAGNVNLQALWAGQYYPFTGHFEAASVTSLMINGIRYETEYATGNIIVNNGIPAFTFYTGELVQFDYKYMDGWYKVGYASDYGTQHMVKCETEPNFTNLDNGSTVIIEYSSSPLTISTGIAGDLTVNSLATAPLTIMGNVDGFINVNSQAPITVNGNVGNLQVYVYPYSGTATIIGKVNSIYYHSTSYDYSYTDGPITLENGVFSKTPVPYSGEWSSYSFEYDNGWYKTGWGTDGYNHQIALENEPVFNSNDGETHSVTIRRADGTLTVQGDIAGDIEVLSGTSVTFNGSVNSISLSCHYNTDNQYVSYAGTLTCNGKVGNINIDGDKNYDYSCTDAPVIYQNGTFNKAPTPYTGEWDTVYSVDYQNSAWTINGEGIDGFYHSVTSAVQPDLAKIDSNVYIYQDVTINGNIDVIDIYEGLTVTVNGNVGTLIAYHNTSVTVKGNVKCVDAYGDSLDISGNVDTILVLSDCMIKVGGSVGSLMMNYDPEYYSTGTYSGDITVSGTVNSVYINGELYDFSQTPTPFIITKGVLPTNRVSYTGKWETTNYELTEEGWFRYGVGSDKKEHREKLDKEPNLNAKAVKNIEINIADKDIVINGNVSANLQVTNCKSLTVNGNATVINAFGNSVTVNGNADYIYCNHGTCKVTGSLGEFAYFSGEYSGVHLIIGGHLDVLSVYTEMSSQAYRYTGSDGIDANGLEAYKPRGEGQSLYDLLKANLTTAKAPETGISYYMWNGEENGAIWSMEWNVSDQTTCSESLHGQKPDLTKTGIKRVTMDIRGYKKYTYNGDIVAETVYLNGVRTVNGSVKGTLFFTSEEYSRSSRDLTINGNVDTLVLETGGYDSVTVTGTVGKLGFSEDGFTVVYLPGSYKNVTFTPDTAPNAESYAKSIVLDNSLFTGASTLSVERFADNTLPDSMKDITNTDAGYLSALKVTFGDHLSNSDVGTATIKVCVGKSQAGKAFSVYTRIGGQIKRSEVTADADGFVSLMATETSDIVIRSKAEVKANEAKIECKVDTSGLTIPEDVEVELVSEQVPVAELPAEVREFVSEEALEDVEVCVAFEVTLTVDQQQMLEDFGVLTLTFEVGKDYAGQKVLIYHVHGEEIYVYEKVVGEDGNVSVEVDKLSTFVIRTKTAEEKNADEPKKEEPNPTVPVTGDNNQIVLWSLVLTGAALSLAGLFAASRKKENE